MRFVYYILLLSVCSVATASPSVSTGIIPYQKTTERMYGDLIVRGSTRLEPMIRAWFKEFSTLYPNIQTNIKASGSGSAPKALISGVANIGAMSRKIKRKEIKAFVKEKGYPPLELKVAMDALAVYVNRKNPINKLTLTQVEAIYATTRKCASKNGRNQESLDAWTQLGWKDGGDIEIHNFHSKSGGYYYPDSQHIASSNYPLSRFLYLYIDKPPSESLPSHL